MDKELEEALKKIETAQAKAKFAIERIDTDEKTARKKLQR